MTKPKLPGFLKRLATGRRSARRVTRPVRNISEHYTIRARAVLDQAALEAKLSHHSQIEIEHLLLALIQNSAGLPAQLLVKFEVTSARLRTIMAFGSVGQPLSSPIPHYCDVTYITELATASALYLNHPYIGTEHLLLGILEAEDQVAGPLHRLNVNLSELRQQLDLVLQKPEYQPFAYQ